MDIVLIAGGAGILIIILVVVIVQQMRSSSRIEKLKETAAKKTAPEPKKAAPKQVAQPTPQKPAAKPAAPAQPAAAAPVKERPAPVAPPAPPKAPPAPPKAPVAPPPPPPPARPKPRPVVPVAVAKEYPLYSNARAVENLGLSQEEADMFVEELVGQIEGEMPTLQAAVDANDLDRLEKVSHMLKGSATSLGEGGVADVLVDFNTYCKEGNDINVIKTHMSNLQLHLGRLKEQFPG